MFSSLPPAEFGGDAEGVGVGVCVGGIGLLFDIFGAPPGDRATYTLQHTASYCSTLQRTATHCNTLQHNATHYSTRYLVPCKHGVLAFLL